MKKKLLLYALIGCMGVSLMACGKKATTSNTDTTEKTTDSGNDAGKSDIVEDQNEGDFSYADLEGYSFDFCSGAGGWATYLEIEKDGSFSGDYHDSEMGDTGDKYPDGTIYLCKFSGKFGDLTKVDDLTYKTTISQITFENKEDTEEISDGVRYVYTYAYGLEDSKDIYFYLKGGKVSDLPEGYVDWLIGKIDVDDANTTLPFIGLYNENAKEGFCGNEAYTEEADTTSESGSTASVDEYYAKYEECLAEAEEIEYSLQNDDMSQTDMNFKAQDLYELWDEHLNYLWGILKSTLPEDEMAKLTTEEKQWISDKEAAMDEAAEEYNGGSIAGMIYNKKGAELTKQRVEELQKYLK